MSLSTHDFSFFGFVGEGRGGGVIPPVHKIWKVPIVTFWLVSWVKKKKTLPKSRWVVKDNGVASAIKESAKYPMTHSSSFSARYENRALKTWMFLYKKKEILFRRSLCRDKCIVSFFLLQPGFKIQPHKYSGRYSTIYLCVSFYKSLLYLVQWWTLV